MHALIEKAGLLSGCVAMLIKIMFPGTIGGETQCDRARNIHAAENKAGLRAVGHRNFDAETLAL